VRIAARPLGGGWVWQVAVGGLVLLLLGRLAVVPLDARVEQVRRAYGLSTRDWPAWAGDLAKGFAVSAGLTLVILVGVVALSRVLPRWWWAPAAAGGAVLVAVVSFAYPLAVEPVFNHCVRRYWRSPVRTGWRSRTC
jgi:STE24 endopeptidase